MSGTTNGVGISKIVQIMDLYNFLPDIELKGHRVMINDVNRPALQLSGFFEHFEQSRVQIIGNVEYTYLQHMDTERKKEIYTEFMSYDIPCIIFCRDLQPDELFLEIAEANNIPVLGTKRSTSEFMAELIYCLGEWLAPCISIHGVLVDVYGEGLLIMGESGIGKSEAALELLRRGHRLVTDDVVEIRKINEHKLIGTSPDITRYFIELRGIGIVDVKNLYGVESVKEKQEIDLVIKLEEWKKDKEYDRLGMEEEYTEILGNKVVCHSLPIRPGRNLAVICETAAVNHRQKKQGYNAAQELYRRWQENMTKSNEDEE
ncbi:MAG: HPr(Ser) kinase/phosphatase [Lachnospiraceae bacterium]|nr:HPr(Ser) kinase/phosphatase [Lachnospiraceae bacterium]